MEAAPPKLRTPANARNYLLTNLLVLPGLGSFLAKQKLAGLVQMAGAIAGFILTAFWFVSFAIACLQQQQLAFDGGPHFRLGLAGVGLFALSWLWSLATGLQILRAARTTSA